MSNYSLGVIGIGILSVGVVGISLKVAFTTLKPHFNQSFERLEFANGTLYTQAEHNAELLSKLGKEIGRVQDKIALLMNQLEDVRSSVDLADPAVPSSSASSTPRRRRSRIGPFARPESDEEVGIESASEGESDDEPEEEADRRQAGPTTVLEGGEEIPVISASTSSASYSPPEDLPLPLVTSSATSTASSSRPDRSKIVSRTLSSSSLIPQTNHADRIFRSMQKSSEQCRAATQRRHEDFEMRQAQKTSSALTTLNQGSSLSAPGLMDTLKTRTAMAATSLAAAAGAGAGGSSTGQVGLVNNQYYSLIHIQTPSSVPDFLNFGKYFSSIVRTGIFSAIYSVIV